MGAETKSAKPEVASKKKQQNVVDSSTYQALYELVSPHINSFDYFLQRGLTEVLADIDPVEIDHPTTGTTMTLSLERPVIQPPMKDAKTGNIDNRLMPSECRQGFFSYCGNLTIDLNLDMNGAFTKRQQISFGRIPIMLRSSICHLKGLSPQKLVAAKEEATEMGGYFMTKGIERIIRMVILPKRNHVLALQRTAFQNRGPGYSDKGVIMRCVRPDQTAATIKVYYLNHGTASLGFTPQRQEFVIPVGILLKAFFDTNDREIFEQLCAFHTEDQETKGAVGSQLVSQRAKIILEEVQRLNLLTRLDCLRYLGESFRLQLDASPKLTDAEVGDKLIRKYIFVHVDDFRDKFNVLIHMLQRLFAFVDGTVSADNPDALQHQELLLPGQLFGIFLKDRLEDWLIRFKRIIQKELQTKGSDFDLHDTAKITKLMDKSAPSDVGKRIEYLLATGSMTSNSFMDLQQFTGFSVVAEKLNFFRFISHFRSVHRGAFFAKQRTTTVRKLLPESWGFVCPVHTPDGEPCGLLTHLASVCKIATDLDKNNHTKDPTAIRQEITTVLVEFGMLTAFPMIVIVAPPRYLAVLLDGRVLGYMLASSIPQAIDHLRSLKVDKSSGVPEDLEIGYVPSTYAGAYPGLFLYSTPSRFLRPIKQLTSGAIELVAPFEQAYMEITCPDGGDGGRTESSPTATHIEIHPTNMLSVVASLTPWSDHNQSPRNMYQCQMGKQTMGFPSQALNYRTDHKMYRIQTPQTPVARNMNYTKYSMDEFPAGTNAVVAVLAYTGYDMEDAMIMNKSSMERGLCHGQIYKTEVVDLTQLHKKKDGIVNVFARPERGKNAAEFLDSQGLPHIGQILQDGDPYCSVLNTMTGETKMHKLKSAETVVVDSVHAIGNGKDPLQKVAVKFRHERNPVIGDKFSSRHGQKGVLSQLWPDIDMPFSEVTGMRPDIIINPHAFPSRMTIGMLLESMAAKAGVLNGQFVDSTPFQASMREPGTEGTDLDDYPAVSEFGAQLVKRGFNYHGTEEMYSGVLGTELTFEIYFGVVYYQRLRHMVSDKFQCRSKGPVNQVTRQPVGGRKLGGGIRFGEMERDSLLAHGAAYLLHDRLHTSSDHHVADVCKTCGSLLSTLTVPPKKSSRRLEASSTRPSNVKKTTCKNCDSSEGVTKVAMPFVFRYLAAELAAMNVKLELDVGHIE